MQPFRALNPANWMYERFCHSPEPHTSGFVFPIGSCPSVRSVNWREGRHSDVFYFLERNVRQGGVCKLLWEEGWRGACVQELPGLLRRWIWQSLSCPVLCFGVVHCHSEYWLAMMFFDYAILWFVQHDFIFFVVLVLLLFVVWGKGESVRRCRDHRKVMTAVCFVACFAWEYRVDHGMAQQPCVQSAQRSILLGCAGPCVLRIR